MRALIFLCLWLLIPLAPASAATDATPSAEIVVQPNLEQQLSQLLDSAERRQHTLDALNNQRTKTPSGPTSIEIDKEIESTQKQLSDLREQFLQLATNNFSFNLNQTNAIPQVDINWQDDMIQIIHPLLLELKDLTERPRNIERLNGEINYYREQSKELDDAQAHITQLEKSVQDEALQHALKSLAIKIKERRDDITQKLNTLERQLHEQHEQPSQLPQSIASGIRSFAINIGLYLLLATLASFTVFIVVRLLGKIVCKAILDRYDERLIVVERGVHLLTQVLGVLLTGITFLAVLYAVNAWVLFALSLIITLGIVLSLRSMVPTYVMEVRTLLNLGSLRQNERLIINGLPWRIVSLDVYTLLHNPALGAFMRMPLTQISGLSSRPWLPEEPWFPTDVGDFVQLLDNIFGRVDLQTTETVQLNVGNSIVNYRTEIFLNQRPQNLSKRGFTVITDFGIAYRHQHEATNTVVDTLRYELEGALAQTEFGAHRTTSNVELKSAGASSLDFRIFASFNGGAAEMYPTIQRWLQKFAIDCANKHDWEIPFPQMTVHYSDDSRPKDDKLVRAENQDVRNEDLPPEMIHI